MTKRNGIAILIVGLAIGGSLVFWPAQAIADESLAPLVQVLATLDDPAIQLDLLTGMRDGLKGRKEVPMPEGWNEVYVRLRASKDERVRDMARTLAITFGDARAIEEVRQQALSTAADGAARTAALELLIARRVPDLAPILQSLVTDRAVRRAALRGLAAYQDSKTPEVILARYDQFDADEKQDALATLASRREYAEALVGALEKKIVPRRDVSSFLIRQLHALGDEELNQRLKEAWGEVRESPQDKIEKLAAWQKQLTPETLAKADVKNGRRVFQRTCQQCHVLFGEGAKIGPDLTGSNRANLEYVLTNVIDPSAVIAREYKMNVVVTTDGRVLTGMIVERVGDRLTLQTANERLVLVKEDIEELNEAPLSMMPEGQLDALSPQEVRDLVAYLATDAQVELD